MELSDATIEHLRDEAYASLCRQALESALQRLEQEKAELASTRPPFGVLARKETREAFTRSMRTATESETVLRSRLVQISQLETWLQGILRPELREYLMAVAPEYRRFAITHEMLDQWGTAFGAMPELVLALARDIGAIRQNPEAARARRELHLFAVLRDTALRVEEQLFRLDAIAKQLEATVPAIASSEVRTPALPDLRHVAWVNTLAVMPLDQLVAETTAAEKAARAFVAQGHRTALIRLQASHDSCTGYEEAYLERYWNQLRTHAQTHYVEERDIAEVIASLTHRYVTTDLARRQLALTTNPFLVER